jgi:hypothetical protein
MQSRRACSVLCCALATLAGLFSSTANAGPITAGNLVIYRVGDGAAALGTTATAVFLDEYTPAGSLVQSIALPTTGTGALTAVGNATTEGIISPSQDGSSLIFTGYAKTAGGTSPASDTYTTTPRVIGTVTAAGTPNTTTTVINDNGATTANTIRSATTVDGSVFWTSTSTRVSYYGSPIGSAAGTTQIDARNSRQVNLAGNTLYASNGSTAITQKVQSYGTLPTGATSPTAVVTLATADAVNGFALFDLSAGVAGPDTLYALSTVEGLLRKYSYDGTNWLANGSLAASGINNLAGVANGSTVTLFLTTTSVLKTLADSSGYNTTITGTFTDLATAATNTGFRGIGVLVPEPATAMMLVAAVTCLGAGFRRRG